MQFDVEHHEAIPMRLGKPKRKDLRKGDRHRPGYFAEYMRGYRERQRLKDGKTE